MNYVKFNKEKQSGFFSQTNNKLIFIQNKKEPSFDSSSSNASDGTWTRTPKTHAPQTCLSANSSTLAYKCRHLSIFPGRRQPSIFDVKELNFCVRNGNRWNLFAISTDYLLNWIYSDFYSHYFFSYKLLSNTLGKALDRLVPARLTPHSAYTLGLSTS